MRALIVVVPGLLLLSGCLPEQWLNPADSSVELVPNSPFSAPGPVTVTTAKVNYAAGDQDTALHVSQIGNELVTASPGIGMRPRFALYGTPNTEIFHSGTYLVHITDGLVKKCQNDGQLAALLAHELAQMVVEREALANPKMRTGEKRPPADVIIGNGIGDREPDQLHLAELARCDKTPKKDQGKPLPLPDTDTLTRELLEKAGYNKEELENVRPLLKDAERTYVLEKQLKQAGLPNLGAPTGNDGKAPASSTSNSSTPIGSWQPAPVATPGGGTSAVPDKAPPPLPGVNNLQLPPTLNEDASPKPAPVPVYQNSPWHS